SAQPRIISAVGFGNPRGFVLIEGVYVYGACAPRLHGVVKAARPFDLACVLGRIVPEANQYEVESLCPLGECRRLRMHPRCRSMRMFQNRERTRGRAPRGEIDEGIDGRVGQFAEKT